MPLHCTYSQPISRTFFSVPGRSFLAGSRMVYSCRAMRPLAFDAGPFSGVSLAVVRRDNAKSPARPMLLFA